MKYLIFILVSILAASVNARPQYFNELKAAVPKGKNMLCITCHNNGRALNAFGMDYFTVYRQGGATKEAFAKLMNLDSDKDGITNYVELMNGTAPGFPNK